MQNGELREINHKLYRLNKSVLLFSCFHVPLNWGRSLRREKLKRTLQC